jgi:hypothetical protein
MKVLAAILLVTILAVGAYLLVEKGDKGGQAGNGPDLQNGGEAGDPASDLPKGMTAAQLVFTEDKPASGDLGQTDLAKVDRSRWSDYRNPLERKIPDPDTIGPCPPPQLGGHPTLVVRRFLDHETGDRVWMHEDGSMTMHHYERSKDPGRKEEIGRWIISTAVPTPDQVSAPGSRR